MAELKDLIKYIPEAVGYFQGRRAIKDEVDRLREQDPVRQDRIEMDPSLQQAFREGNTRGDVDQQENIGRAVQEAIRRNPRNIAKAIEAGQVASGKTRAADNLRRIKNLTTAGTLGQRLNQLNAAIDLGNEFRERQQEDRIANAEFQNKRLNLQGLSTLGDLIGDAVNITPRDDEDRRYKVEDREDITLTPLTQLGAREVDIDSLKDESIAKTMVPQSLQSIGDARAEDEANMSGIDLQLSRNEDNTIFTDSKYDRQLGASTLSQLLDENELNPMGAYTTGKNNVPLVDDPSSLLRETRPTPRIPLGALVDLTRQNAPGPRQDQSIFEGIDDEIAAEGRAVPGTLVGDNLLPIDGRTMRAYQGVPSLPEPESNFDKVAQVMALRDLARRGYTDDFIFQDLFRDAVGPTNREGGAVVTPDGYDHDGVDINMTDAENGKFLGSVESAEMIVNAEDTNEGLRLAKKNPNNPLSKWYLNLTKRFQKEAKEREAQNKR